MKLSIITINLNNKAGLEKTMHSVISQTSKDFEWIVIDGGSTDGSKELIEQNAQHIAYWVSEPDKGVYNAMNKGIDVAKGEYLQFLNSGDYLADSSIIGQFLRLQFTEDVIYGNAVFVNKEGKETNKYNAPERLTLSYFWNHTLNHQATFISKRCFANYRYNEGNRIKSDSELFMHLIYNGFSFKNWDKLVVCRECGGISSVINARSEFVGIVNRLLPQGIKEDYDNFIMFRDVDLAIMIKDIIRSNRFMRNLARVFIYPIYFICKLWKTISHSSQ